MPQGKLFGEDEVAQVRITLTYNDLKRTMEVSCRALSRLGVLLASAGATTQGIEEAELLPLWAAECVNGFLYRGAQEAALIPTQALRARKRSLAE